VVAAQVTANFFRFGGRLDNHQTFQGLFCHRTTSAYEHPTHMTHSTPQAVPVRPSPRTDTRRHKSRQQHELCDRLSKTIPCVLSPSSYNADDCTGDSNKES